MRPTPRPEPRGSARLEPGRFAGAQDHWQPRTAILPQRAGSLRSARAMAESGMLAFRHLGPEDQPPVLAVLEDW